MTIGRLAKCAGVGVETVRFYQRSGLLETPPQPASGYRKYPPETILRIRFIKRAKSLGFSLKEISALTLTSHVQPGRLKEIENRENWLLCMSSTCPIIYFHEARVVGANEVKTLPFHKDTSSDRLVCFCFEHLACDIREEVLAKGHSTIRDSVRDACRAGLDDCERKNPQGRCCFGNIGLVLKEAESSTQSSSSRAKPCCNS